MTDETQQDLFFVIGAGLGRTGTHSLRAALMNLGYSKVFHMKEILDGVANPEPWFELARSERKAGTKLPDLALQTAQGVIDQGYMATTDYPTCLLYPEFLQLKPNGKVILSVRSNPKDWEISVMDTIGIIHLPLLKPPFSYMPFFQGFASSLAPWIWERTGGIAPLGGLEYPFDSLGEHDLEGSYTQWLNTVKETVPPSQLLIHHAKDGYAPICEFLEIPKHDCPKEPYPYIADTKEMKDAIRLFETINLMFWPAVVLLLVIIVWVATKCIGGRSKENGGKKEKDN